MAGNCNLKKVNIVCLKWGTKYGPEYVNNLFSAIKRHTTIPVSLHCFTDDPSGINPDGVTIHPLPDYGLEIWWNKLYLFSNEVNFEIGSRIVFFDLDTLVTSNIDDILLLDVPQIVALRDFYTGIAESVKGTHNMGSGFMSWKHGNYTAIWDRFIKNPQKVIKSLHPHGDQRWIQMNTPDRLYWQDIFPDRVVSFKVHCRDGLPAKASVVCYHGIPSIPDSITNFTKSWKWHLEPAPWVLDHWPTKIEPKLAPAVIKEKPATPRTYFAWLNPTEIFGMVGRCGGGYNTVWEDWSPEGRVARAKIIREYEEGIDRICGHYAKLEDSVLDSGFRNPLIVTCGYPVRKSIKHLPPEFLEREPERLLLLEGTTGGSRLWVAQKYNILVPCLVNDFTGKFNRGEVITTIDRALLKFKDKPKNLQFNAKIGLVEEFDAEKIGHHLGDQWSEDKLVKQRAPLWVSIMNKYGYYVDRLKPEIVELLANAGVYQPINLKKRYIDPST